MLGLIWRGGQTRVVTWTTGLGPFGPQPADLKDEAAEALPCPWGWVREWQAARCGLECVRNVKLSAKALLKSWGIMAKAPRPFVPARPPRHVHSPTHHLLQDKDGHHELGKRRGHEPREERGACHWHIPTTLHQIRSALPCANPTSHPPALHPTHQQRRFKTEEEYNAFLRVAHESVVIGRETLTAVAGQQEALDRAENVVESNRYMIDKSARTLRGMTWWGSVKNYFSEEPVAPRPKTSVWMAKQQQAEQGGGGPQASAGTASAAAGGQWREAPNHGSGRGGNGGDQRQELYARSNGNGQGPVAAPLIDARVARAQAGSATPHSLAEVARIQDEYLDRLGQTVDEQRAIGGTLHEALTEQNVQVDRLGSSSEGLHDKTRAVVRKAARVSRAQGGWGAERPKLHKFVAFRELRTKLFLTVVGEELRLQEPQMVKACQFAAYTCQTNLTGLQSVLSRKWLGQHWITGSLGVRGAGLGKNEEWEVDWRRPAGAFVLSCSANWGNGGYLLVVPKETGVPELRLGGYDVEDRAKAALFEIVDCDTYRTTEVVTEVMVKKTPAELAAEEEARKKKGWGLR